MLNALAKLKKCWWNWDQGSISPTFSRAFFARVFCTHFLYERLFSSYVQKRARPSLLQHQSKSYLFCLNIIRITNPIAFSILQFMSWTHLINWTQKPVHFGHKWNFLYKLCWTKRDFYSPTLLNILPLLEKKLLLKRKEICHI